MSAEQYFVNGEQAYKQGDYATALRCFEPLAHGGHAVAAYYLGRMHSRGEGITQSLVSGFKYYRRSAEQGYAPAQYQLGYAYEHGLGVEQNDQTAYAWYHIADKNGSELAAEAKNRMLERPHSESIVINGEVLAKICIDSGYILYP